MVESCSSMFYFLVTAFMPKHHILYTPQHNYFDIFLLELKFLIVAVTQHTLIQSYKRTFSISFFWVCTDDIEIIFCLNLCIYMDKSLVVFWKSFLVLLRFLVKNAKNNIFEDKCFFE